MSQSPRESLEARLRKANIDPDVFADMIWGRIKPKMIALLKDMAKQHGAKRQEILVAAITGLAVNFREVKESNGSLAEWAERLTEAVMREEERRTEKGKT